MAVTVKDRISEAAKHYGWRETTTPGGVLILDRPERRVIVWFDKIGRVRSAESRSSDGVGGRVDGGLPAVRTNLRIFGERVADAETASPAELRHLADIKESRDCTGVAARWCPIHDTCTCADPGDLDDESCPLHSSASSHAEAGLAAIFGGPVVAAERGGKRN